jgi:hypothetical protein
MTEDRLINLIYALVCCNIFMVVTLWMGVGP